MTEALLAKIFESQGEMNAKLDVALEHLKGHDRRITVLERQWMKLFGWLGAIGTGITILAKVAFGRKA